MVGSGPAPRPIESERSLELAGRRVSRIQRSLLYEEAAKRIRELIEREGLHGSYLASERELAGLFGVSRETVRKGLELLERKGVVARERGRGTLVVPGGERPNGQRIFAVASPHEHGPRGPYENELIAGLAEGAGLRGWPLTFIDVAAPAGQKDLLARLEKGGMDGLFFLSVTDKKLIEDVLGGWGGACVLIDHHFPEMQLTSIIDDSEGGVMQVMEHLLSLGHRRIGYVGSSSRSHNPWRYSGYVEALEGVGVDIDQDLIVSAFSSFDSGREAGEKLLGLADRPTAVVAFDDVRALGVWRAAENSGMNVGRDLAIVGYGDVAVRIGLSEELSSVRFDAGKLGRIAAEKMDLLTEGREAGELVRVPVELVVRRSSEGARPD